MLLGSMQAGLSTECKPHHFRAPFFIKNMGACAFDPETLSFAGTPVEQAMCLMRGMDATRNLGPPLTVLPPGLASRIGQTTGLPSREALSSFLSKQNLETDFAAHLWQPLSRAHDNDPDAPMARYFVIHDTSGPNYGHRGFPDNIDTDPQYVNNLADYACSDGWGKAHVFVNRTGDMLVDHDYRDCLARDQVRAGGGIRRRAAGTVPAQRADPAAPARRPRRRNDAQSPDPAFTAAQYDRLALLYTIASVRRANGSFPRSMPPSTPKFPTAMTIR